MTHGKRVSNLNWILFAILTVLTIEALFRRHHETTSNTITQNSVSTQSSPAVLQHSLQSPTHSKVGKLFMQYGPLNPMYERALATHIPHNEQHGYRMSILRRPTVKFLWSKPAFMLSHILQELEKPEAQRLEWFFWFDSDMLLLNPNIPLESFLPPRQHWNHIRALVVQDRNGLNTGAFALRVDRWSAMFLAATLATPHALPHLKLKYNDQSAMEYWLQSDLYRNSTMHVPQRWLNAYPGRRGNTPGLPADPNAPQSAAQRQPFTVREGDLAVHFAGGGDTRAPRMLPWLDVAEQRLKRWEVAWNETTYPGEISEFWEREAGGEWERVEAMREKCGYQYS
ncbi:uncharacterized protein HMPREF1541_09577 [Cyphellophora europaea CBS 101466]|uniref:Galactosyl transferase GMA12/MNN10 family protein n=1 Tax=Cyphellophora europaea (strain CBS 101466) TaxID=1220924 RepID=W2SCT9_CYPE1|nr:uncharacterized protein HMPREF1541_09577 [Cyphellophora europaea CBS 101466]ETN45744.1 hypothetical protein HMPREF1541_09577 [Cyphellophora europaea CBS 101466]